MKTKLIPALLAAATLTSAFAQSSPAGAPKAGNSPSTSGSGYGSSTSSRTRAGGGQNAYGTASSAARYETRLSGIVRRASGPGSQGSIILTSPLPSEKFDELVEDLNVLTLIMNRNLDRIFGEKGTEYRLGVPITMSGNRIAETSYIQDFGVLMKIHVPFPVATAGEREKKPQPAAAPDTEWEKARRALYASDADASAQRIAAEANGVGSTPAYDQKIVEDLKKEILDALKNISNVRHMAATESATVAILGSADAAVTTIDPLTGLPSTPEPTRPTVLTIRIRKGDAGENLADKATVAAYFDTAIIAPSTVSGGGYGAGAGMFGGDYGYSYRPATR